MVWGVLDQPSPLPTPITLVVGSTNPVKTKAGLEAVRAALRPGELEVVSVDVSSGVPDQPFGDEETLRGARNRAEGARRAHPHVGEGTTLWVGIEGGVVEREGALEGVAWAVVLGCHGGTELRGESRSATFTLPTELADLVRTGVELGEATDRVFSATDTKRGTGTVGPLTGGVIDRVAYYAHAMVLALVPLRNPGLTFSGNTARSAAAGVPESD